MSRGADRVEMTRDALERCRASGFALAGVARAEPTRHRAELEAWLADGRHGTMAYLERHAPILVDPNELLPGALSIICVADRHHHGQRDAPEDADGPPRGRIARYARGADYHKVIRKRLHALADALSAMYPDERFRSCVDTAPLLEREYASAAGLGAIGKHTLVIDPGLGSWLLLGEIVTTLDLEPSEPAAPDPCGTCTRCIDACPTDAITPWSIDATRCISYLTIEHREEIAPDLHEGIGPWIFGCDVCQEVCPHNHPTRQTRRAAVHSAYREQRQSLNLLEVIGWTEDKRRVAFTGSAMKRAKLAMMRRNALIAAGNALRQTDHPALRQRIEAVARDESEDEMVRRTAVEVARRIR